MTVYKLPPEVADGQATCHAVYGDDHDPATPDLSVRLKKKFCAFTRVSPELVECASSMHVVEDYLFRTTVRTWQERYAKIEPIVVPLTWIDAVKRRWLPRWLHRWFPIRETVYKAVREFRDPEDASPIECGFMRYETANGVAQW